jgi:putative polyhydroxyalkanoate system protein
MPDISLSRDHTLGLDGAKTAADKMADKLGEKFDLTGDWKGNTLHFARPGVTGSLSITATSMALEVSLGFLLKAMKGPIEKAVNEQLDKVLKEAKPAVVKKPEAKKAETSKTAAKKPVAKKK